MDVSEKKQKKCSRSKWRGEYLDPRERERERGHLLIDELRSLEATHHGMRLIIKNMSLIKRVADGS
jgi:hypothetical protein